MAAELLATLLEGLVATSAAVLLVLAARAGWQRIFGPGLLPLLWTAVPLAQLGVLLPAPIQRAVEAPPAIAMAQPSAVAAVGQSATREDLARVLLAIWLLGGVALGARLARQQRRFRRALGTLTERPDGHRSASASHLGPVVIGLFRPRIVLPADFEQRFDAEQRALILAHEQVHVRRGDVVARAIACALRCVYWFNPLLHLATTRLRLDQELAADAEVLRRHPRSRRRYADTLLKAQLAVPGLPVGCLWQSSHPLKERILMLRHPATPRSTRGIGATVATALSLGACALAWAGQPAQAPGPSPAAAPPRGSAAAEPATYRRISRPAYPPQAVEAGQAGKVLLEVLVGVDGVPRDVRVAESSAPGVFDVAAIASVRTWRFNPTVKDGRPVESWVIVPICYSTDPTSSDCRGPDAAEALEAIHTRPEQRPANPG